MDTPCLHPVSALKAFLRRGLSAGSQGPPPRFGQERPAQFPSFPHAVNERLIWVCLRGPEAKVRLRGSVSRELATSGGNPIQTRPSANDNEPSTGLLAGGAAMPRAGHLAASWLVWARPLEAHTWTELGHGHLCWSTTAQPRSTCEAGPVESFARRGQRREVVFTAAPGAGSVAWAPWAQQDGPSAEAVPLTSRGFSPQPHLGASTSFLPSGAAGALNATLNQEGLPHPQGPLL